MALSDSPWSTESVWWRGWRRGAAALTENRKQGARIRERREQLGRGPHPHLTRLHLLRGHSAAVHVPTPSHLPKVLPLTA